MGVRTVVQLTQREFEQNEYDAAHLSPQHQPHHESDNQSEYRAVGVVGLGAARTT